MLHNQRITLLFITSSFIASCLIIYFFVASFCVASLFVESFLLHFWSGDQQICFKCPSLLGIYTRCEIYAVSAWTLLKIVILGRKKPACLQINDKVYKWPCAAITTFFLLIFCFLQKKEEVSPHLRLYYISLLHF